MKQTEQRPVCRDCRYMEPESHRNGRNIFYCSHPEAKTECLPQRIITRSRSDTIPTKTAPKWCPLTPEDHPSKNHCKNCKYAEGYGNPDGFTCRAKREGIRGEQYGCNYFSQRKEEE